MRNIRIRYIPAAASRIALYGVFRLTMHGRDRPHARPHANVQTVTDVAEVVVCDGG